jgi:hypothetical protein
MKQWIAFFAAMLLTGGIATACPLCKDGTPNSGGRAEDAVADTAGVNFNPSIYGLLGGVGVVAGVAGFAMVRSVAAGKGTD